MSPAAERLGATPLPGGRCAFRVWAPDAGRVEVHVPGADGRTVPLEPEERGFHAGVVDGVEAGTRYRFRLDGVERPDPASRFQPEGVHGPSEVVDPSAFPWSDAGWNGPALDDYLVYELHVGTFSAAGTFDGVIDALDELAELGVTAVELMPVAQFPGARNWGYDGVFPFAAQNSYGGPHGLARLVDACHRRGLAVVLDVVYNHVGPEGNVLGDFGPYFTDRYRTPWGRALNFDGPHGDDVRRYFIESALYWLGELRIDALRLDALHAILDLSAYPFLAELADRVRDLAAATGRRLYLIAESDLNDSRLIRPRAQGGFGLDAQWNDDFHHALHALLTGESHGHYRDFGNVRDLAKAFTEGYVYTGQRSRFRGRRHGNASGDLPARQFLVFGQNHDQVGNRMLGDRWTRLVSFEALKLGAGAVLLSPFVPLLFMGEEYAEPACFQYFTHHSDPGLIRAVRQGRRRELAAFGWAGEAPDAQDEATFHRSKPDRGRRETGPHRRMLDFYRELIRLRKRLPALSACDKERMRVDATESPPVLGLHRRSDRHEAWAVFHFGREPAASTVAPPAGAWEKRLDSADACWAGPGSAVPDRWVDETRPTLSPESFVLFERKD
ncbi:MAG: malto-oligosyltrehalose trehalohydrolase [Gemmatimonadota bacterium]